MIKIVSLFSFLFFLTLGGTHSLALPPCPSGTNATWDNCFGTHIFGVDTEGAEDKYIGEWKNGKEHGHRTFTYPDGRKEVGEWKNDKLNGYAIIYNSDGSIDREGIFKDYDFLYA